MTLKNFIYFSTLLSIFTEALRYNIGFDLKFFYLVIFINTFLFVSVNKIRYTNGLLFFHVVILCSGLFSCIFGYNNFGYFFVQLFFLILIPTFYYSFFNFFEDKCDNIVLFYCRSCVALAIIGAVKLPFDMLHGESFHSLMLEPAHYCTVVLPAFFITLRDSKFPRYYYLTILLSIILSGSSLGFIGLGLSMLLFSKSISVLKTAMASFLVFILGFTLYLSYPPFTLRMDDTFNSFIDRDLSKANLSTYALLSNLFVSTQSFMSNPLIGNGIGSHIQSRALYLGNVEGIEVFEKLDMDHLNAQDAGSLFSRLMSELGLVGIIGVFYFITKFYVSNQKDALSPNAIISRGLILYFFAKLFREGHYFSPEMYFFVFLYVFNKYDDNKKRLIDAQ